MKKVVRILSTVLLGVMLTGVGSRLISCKNDSYVDPDRIAQTDQGFRYMVSEDETETTAIILGVADTERKEELVIPEKLGGCRVKQIGYYLPSVMLGGSERYWSVDGNRYSRIILNHPVDIVDRGIINSKGIIYINNDMIFVDKNGVEQYCSIAIDVDYSIITFMPQGGTLTTYEMLVFYEGTIPKPVDPIKEGATFDGWYKDEELTQKFDFENEIVNDKGWQFFTYLYAKWSEN